MMCNSFGDPNLWNKLGGGTYVVAVLKLPKNKR